MAKEKRYEKGELTVVWQPEKCIHSENCWRGLNAVFNPKARPWIDVEGASQEAIMAQIDQCPSGALSYLTTAAGEGGQTETETIVEVAPNGPLMVYGNLTIKHADGSERKEHRVTALCRCGQSANKPYCDGTHKKVGFEG